MRPDEYQMSNEFRRLLKGKSKLVTGGEVMASMTPANREAKLSGAKPIQRETVGMTAYRALTPAQKAEHNCEDDVYAVIKPKAKRKVKKRKPPRKGAPQRKAQRKPGKVTIYNLHTELSL